MQTQVVRAADRALSRHVRTWLQRSATPALGASIELYDRHAMEAALRRARLLPGEARDGRTSYLRRVGVIGATRRLVAPPNRAALADLRCRFPHASDVVDFVEESAALAWYSDLPAAQIPPILLLGPGGVGKTALARGIAATLGVRLTEVALGATSAGFVLSGLDVGYSTGKPGKVFETVALGMVGNPVILLDELDKATGDSHHEVTPVLYGLLEPLTARRFEDEAVPLPINASCIQWIATANYESRIENALLSRFETFSLPLPTSEQNATIIGYVYRDIVANSPWGKRFPPDPGPELLGRFGEMSVRDARRALHRAFGRAAVDGRDCLVPDDVRAKQGRTTVGFV